MLADTFASSSVHEDKDARNTRQGVADDEANGNCESFMLPKSNHDTQ